MSVIREVPCHFSLFGESCRVDKKIFEQKLKILSADEKKKQIKIPHTRCNGFYDGGYIHLPNTRENILITNNAADTWGYIVSLKWWSSAIYYTDHILIYPGCNKSLYQCKNKFSNANNFGGYQSIKKATS